MYSKAAEQIVGGIYGVIKALNTKKRGEGKEGLEG
ncbi:MAG: hypothetical protein BTN85_1671 [Candidatus Methanohalarchaeum thermophilum]|uniref:Uncharacterized protein n=1 Tax=Methanohalarchaeum thermophilum TaxID=1903181 RepID=A0A1Q6DXR7_METT1|nr:MAG: hypothetical protein BTN85_1671 [Candidatus Methanohalarchaeum thermophilum]